MRESFPRKETGSCVLKVKAAAIMENAMCLVVMVNIKVTKRLIGAETKHLVKRNIFYGP